MAEQARIQALRGAGAQNMTGAFGDVAQAGMLSQMGGGSSTGGANMLSQLGNTPSVAGNYSGSMGLQRY